MMASTTIAKRKSSHRALVFLGKAFEELLDQN